MAKAAKGLTGVQAALARAKVQAEFDKKHHRKKHPAPAPAPAAPAPAAEPTGFGLGSAKVVPGNFDDTPEPSPEALQEDAARAEAAAQAVNGVTQVQSASAGYGAQQVHTAMSNGFEGGYARTDRGLSCVAIAGTGAGMERDYDGDGRIFQRDLRSPEDIGQSAGNRAHPTFANRRS